METQFDQGQLFQKLYDENQVRQQCQKFKVNHDNYNFDDKQAILYLKLRYEGCSSKKAKIFANKRFCRVDNMQEVDGPQGFRQLKRRAVPAYMTQKGWYYNKPSYNMEQQFIQSQKEVCLETSQDEKNNAQFEIHKNAIKKDYKKIINVMKDYFKDLNQKYNFSQIKDRQQQVKKFREISQQSRQSKFHRIFFQQDKIKFTELGNELLNKRKSLQNGYNIIDKLNPFNEIVLQKEIINSKLQCQNINARAQFENLLQNDGEQNIINLQDFKQISKAQSMEDLTKKDENNHHHNKKKNILSQKIFGNNLSLAQNIELANKKEQQQKGNLNNKHNSLTQEQIQEQKKQNELDKIKEFNEQHYILNHENKQNQKIPKSIYQNLSKKVKEQLIKELDSHQISDQIRREDQEFKQMVSFINQWQKDYFNKKPFSQTTRSSLLIDEQKLKLLQDNKIQTERNSKIPYQFDSEEDLDEEEKNILKQDQEIDENNINSSNHSNSPPYHLKKQVSSQSSSIKNKLQPSIFSEQRTITNLSSNSQKLIQNNISNNIRIKESLRDKSTSSIQTKTNNVNNNNNNNQVSLDQSNSIRSPKKIQLKQETFFSQSIQELNNQNNKLDNKKSLDQVLESKQEKQNVNFQNLDKLCKRQNNLLLKYIKRNVFKFNDTFKLDANNSNKDFKILQNQVSSLPSQIGSDNLTQKYQYNKCSLPSSPNRTQRQNIQSKNSTMNSMEDFNLQSSSRFNSNNRNQKIIERSQTQTSQCLKNLFNSSQLSNIFDYQEHRRQQSDKGMQTPILERINNSSQQQKYQFKDIKFNNNFNPNTTQQNLQNQNKPQQQLLYRTSSIKLIRQL